MEHRIQANTPQSKKLFAMMQRNSKQQQAEKQRREDAQMSPLKRSISYDSGFFQGCCQKADCDALVHKAGDFCDFHLKEKKHTPSTGAGGCPASPSQSTRVGQRPAGTRDGANGLPPLAAPSRGPEKCSIKSCNSSVLPSSQYCAVHSEVLKKPADGKQCVFIGCSSPPLPSHQYCATHSGDPKSKDKANQCVSCGRPALPSKKHCQEHETLRLKRCERNPEQNEGSGVSHVLGSGPLDQRPAAILRPMDSSFLQVLTSPSSSKGSSQSKVIVVA